MLANVARSLIVATTFAMACMVCAVVYAMRTRALARYDEEIVNAVNIAQAVREGDIDAEELQTPPHERELVSESDDEGNCGGSFGNASARRSANGCFVKG